MEMTFVNFYISVHAMTVILNVLPRWVCQMKTASVIN